ncbi:MAG: hypothetical protein ACYDBZ_16055 [Steroidobacteraceae bacterium]
MRGAATGCTAISLDPRFFPGAAALALFAAAGIALLGPHSLKNIVGITLIVVLLSFVPEMIWRKYY